MTRQYEVVYIFDSALEETAINERLARFHALIQQPGIEPPQGNQWGRRTLAYPIRKHESGVRVVDYKDERTLSRFLTERGKILPSRLPGTCDRHQRQLSTANKPARQ